MRIFFLVKLCISFVDFEFIPQLSVFKKKSSYE